MAGVLQKEGFDGYTTASKRIPSHGGLDSVTRKARAQAGARAAWLAVRGEGWRHYNEEGFKRRLRDSHHGARSLHSCQFSISPRVEGSLSFHPLAFARFQSCVDLLCTQDALQITDLKIGCSFLLFSNRCCLLLVDPLGIHTQVSGLR